MRFHNYVVLTYLYTNHLEDQTVTNNNNSGFSLLPSNVLPSNYTIRLSPDLDNETFSGDETIDISVLEETNSIVLNSIELEIDHVYLQLESGSEKKGLVNYDQDTETVTIDFEEPIHVGSAKLHIEFRGILNDQLHGFYISNYVDSNGEDKKMAVTQFEATDARRCFPCWDEPAIKATFQVSMTVKQNLEIITNTLESDRELLNDGNVMVRFKPTPLMSTYLLAFVVGQMKSIEAKGDNDTLVRVWTTEGQENRGRFALDTAVDLLEYYNQYFGIKYPLEKLDHIAIPDFAAGAMENWGAVTYREVALLFDEDSSSPGTRQRIVEIIAHEMAHMWFGDLVTMAWWNDLWLNESFASWMATKATDNLYPDWQVWTQFISEDVSPGMSLDGLENSHSIESEVRNPAEVSQLFDAISYSKGASIIRMLEEFLGPEIFQLGLRDYLKVNAYSNAEGRDLWSAMEVASGTNVPAMMDTWIKQVGYPLIEIEKGRSVDGNTDIDLTQRRFLYSGPNNDSTLWHVPITSISSGQGDEHAQLMTDRTTKFSRMKDSDWIKINSGTTGFYRVKYGPNELDALSTAVNSSELGPSDRLGLLEDTFALVRARFTTADNYMSLLNSYDKDDNYSVWAAISAQLSSLERLLFEQPFVEKFYASSESLFKGVIKRVGWERSLDETHLASLLRSVVLNQGGHFGNENVLDEANRRFQQFLIDKVSITPDLRAVTYALAAESGDRATFEQLLQLADSFDLQEEKVRIQGALTRFKQPDLITRALELSLDPDIIRIQDTPRIIMGLAANPYALRTTWEFMKNNWKEFDRRYGGGGFAVMRLVSITGAFNTAEDASDVKEFFSANPVPAATRTVEQSLERINLNNKWLDFNVSALSEWFD